MNNKLLRRSIIINIKKKICIGLGVVLGIIVIAGLITNYADSARVTTGHEPKCCIKTVSKDGSKVTYWGLGYKVIRYVGVSPNEPYENNIGVKMENWFMKYELPESDIIEIEYEGQTITITHIKEIESIENILANSKYNGEICDGINTHKITLNNEVYYMKESCREIQKGDKQAKITDEDLETINNIISKNKKEKLSNSKNTLTEQNTSLKSEKLDLKEEKLNEFLSYIAYLNQRNDVNYIGMTTEGIKLEIASYYCDFTYKNDIVSYTKKDINLAMKELFNEEISTTQEGAYGLIYDRENDCFTYEVGGDGSCNTYIVKMEEQSYSDGIYTVTFLYSYPSEADFADDTLDECDCFRTKIQLKVNENYSHSKYQLINSETMTSSKVGKVMDFKEN